MALAQPAPQRPARTEVVQVVVRHVIRQVTGVEARRDAGRVTVSESHVEEPEQQRRERHAHGRRHDQPQRIVGMVVVHAVDDPVQARTQSLLRFEVKHEPVQPVLEQRPQRIAAGRQTHRDRHALHREPPRGHHHDQRREDQDGHDRVHARERVQQARLEHRRRGAQHFGATALLIAHVLGPAHAAILLPGRRPRSSGCARVRPRNSSFHSTIASSRAALSQQN